jgi:hypothetical protein
MNIIKHLDKLSGVVRPDQIASLEETANLHLIESSISFTILQVYDEEIHVRTEQGKHISEKYALSKTLIDCTRNLFAPFTTRTIFTHPVPYRASILDIVTPQWLAREQLNHGIKINDFVFHTGIDKSKLTAWINGTIPMSQPVQAMFYNVVKIYSIKHLMNFLNSDVMGSDTLRITKLVDNDGLLKSIYDSNANIKRFDSSFVEFDNCFMVTKQAKPRSSF